MSEYYHYEHVSMLPLAFTFYFNLVTELSKTELQCEEHNTQGPTTSYSLLLYFSLGAIWSHPQVAVRLSGEMRSLHYVTS